MTPNEAYRSREAEHRSRLESIRARGEQVARARVAAFLGAVALLIAWDALTGAAAALALARALLLAAAVALLVALHRRVRAAERRHAAFLALVQAGLARLRRDWDALPRWSEETPLPPGPEHPYAGDLDLFGRASLAALCGPLTTAPGRAALATWLLAAADARELGARQDAVRELAPRLDDRLELASLARRREPPTRAETERLLAWAEAPPRLLGVRWLPAATWLLPAALVGLAAGDLFLGAGPWWLVPAALQLALVRRFGRGAHADFDAAEGAAPALGPYADQVELVRGWGLESPRLRALLGALGADRADAAARGPADSAAARMRRLVAVVDVAQGRRNPVHQLLGLLLLLDLHVHRALERWKAESGPRLRGWLAALGEIEALAAFSSLAHDHPGWSFPEPVEGTRLAATALAHPLLRPDVAVANDVEVGPAGTFLLVTGSNMSGKSTLLRALATNVVLAGAGAPVSASALRLPAVRLHTSIRVQDSLQQGISLFMAELLALSRIVQAARRPSEDGSPVLYLLDEVLHGTNSGDRRVAARTVIRHLLEAGAIGAATTHDLSLAEASDLEARAVPVHFTETARRTPEGPRLDFDYRLKPGLATTRNALLLLEMVGLGRPPTEG